MFLFDLLFGKREKKATPAADPAPLPAEASVPPVEDAGARTAPGTRIHFNPELIPRLTADHQRLLQGFTSIREAAAGGDLATAAQRLETFRNDLQGHLLTENIRFYVYLEHALADAPENHALMRGFRHEMDDIGKAVVAFLGRYRALADDPGLAEGFARDLEGIGAVLVERIRREEETLYPLYRPTV